MKIGDDHCTKFINGSRMIATMKVSATRQVEILGTIIILSQDSRTHGLTYHPKWNEIGYTY